MATAGSSAKGGRIAAIVEHKDASPEQRAIREINSGIYAFDIAPLFAALREIGSANAQGEYYLPDLVKIYRERGLAVETVHLERLAGNSGSQQPQGAGRRGGDFQDGPERRADGLGRHDCRPGHHLHRS